MLAEVLWFVVVSTTTTKSRAVGVVNGLKVGWWVAREQGVRVGLGISLGHHKVITAT